MHRVLLHLALLAKTPAIVRPPREALGQQHAGFVPAAAATGGVDQQLVEQIALGVARTDTANAMPDGVQMVDHFTVRAGSGLALVSGFTFVGDAILFAMRFASENSVFALAIRLLSSEAAAAATDVPAALFAFAIAVLAITR